jgi:site-specific DNA recombinase
MEMTTVLEKPQKRVPITGNAAIYTRVSGIRQEDGASLDVQREACLRYCDEHGLIVVGEFRDVESGLHADRPQYMKAVEMARTKGYDKLVVWRLDRLGRDSAEYIPLLNGLKRQGVDVVSVTQPTESMFMLQVLGIMTKEESRQLSIRVTASKRRRASEGNWGNMAPFGYTTQHQPEGGSILVPNEESPLVTEMFRRYASGKYSLSDLRDYLNENGHLKSRYAIWYMMTNVVYLGIIRTGKWNRSPFMPAGEITEVQGKHEPLTDQETFGRVQTRLAENKSRQRGGTRPKYLFSGLLVCGSCGHKLVGRTASGREGRKWVQYNCNRKAGFGDCKGHSVFETRVRDVVIPPIQALLDRLSQEDVRTAVREELVHQQQATIQGAVQTKENLAETRRRLEARLSKLEDSFLDGDIPRDRYLTRRDEITAQLEEVKTQLAARPHLALPEIEQFFALADAVDIVDGAITIAGEAVSDQWWRDVVEGLVGRVTITGHAIDVQWKDAYGSMLTES